MEIEEVNLSVTNGETDRQRLEQITHSTFEHLQHLITRELQHLGMNTVINDLEIPPIYVSFGSMDDKMIARTAANEIYRVLLTKL